MQRNLCIYHKADWDGKCSAAIVHSYHQINHQPLTLYGMDYGETLPAGLADKHTNVYLVDFCLQPINQMLLLRDQVKRLVWIDHHKGPTEQARLYRQEFDGVQVIDKPAACVLTWQWFFPTLLVPHGVKLLGDFDVWDHTDPDVLWWQFGVRSVPSEPTDKVWNDVFAPFEPHGRHRDLLLRGKAVVSYRKKRDAYIAAQKCHQVVFANRTWIVANHGPSDSYFFDTVQNEDVAGYVLYWHNGTKWKLSLRTDRNDVDVSAVARRYGGNGHAKAAGAWVTELPWVVEKRYASAN